MLSNNQPQFKINSDTRTLDLKEISKHKTKDDLWIILYDKVYDITAILPQHPGGMDIILKHIVKNQDLTKPFEKMQHSSKARYAVSEYCVGSITKNNNNETLFSKLEASKPTASDLSQNIWDYKPSKAIKMQIGKEYNKKRIIGWGDLFSVKIEMLDNQHKKIIELMNKIYNNGSISHFNEFIQAWNIHCETEQYLFDVYKFENYKKKMHIEDHKHITDTLTNLYDNVVKKYNDKIHINMDDMDVNTEPFQCKELISFMGETMGPGFKKHAFEYDSLYVDKLGETDPSVYVKWEKSSRFNLMKPIFPNEDKINLAIFQDAVYGNGQLMLQLQTYSQPSDSQ